MSGSYVAHRDDRNEEGWNQHPLEHLLHLQDVTDLTKSQVLRNIWETVTARHQVDIFLKIKIQPPKSEPREFSISWMWNWSECNYFTLFSAVWLWTKHQLMHKQDLLTPILIFSIKDVKQIYWPSLNGFQQSQPSPGKLNFIFQWSLKPLILTTKLPQP